MDFKDVIQTTYIFNLVWLSAPVKGICVVDIYFFNSKPFNAVCESESPMLR